MKKSQELCMKKKLLTVVLVLILVFGMLFATSCSVVDDVWETVKEKIDSFDENRPENDQEETEKYTVTFVDWDGTVLETKEVEAGKAATAPADPTRDGYFFAGWNKSFDNITANIIVIATYETESSTPACKHNLTATEANDATYTQAGNIAYWFCSECGKYFLDVECKTEISLAETVIPKLDTVEPVKYTIFYVNVPTFGDGTRNPNPTEYSINDEITLQPVAFGYLYFNYWTDENGKIVSKIRKGTTGNKTLTAHWVSMEDEAKQASENEDVTAIVKDNSGKCYFFQKLGTIENIVLSNIKSTSKQDFRSSLEIEESTITSYEASSAETISNSISKSLTKSSGWSDAHSHQVTSKSVEGELNIKDFIKITGNLSWDKSDTDTVSTNGSTGSSTTQTDSLSSTVAYKNNVSQNITLATKVDAYEPMGTYHYVSVGSATVYVVVIYDFVTGEYSCSTFSTVNDGIKTMFLFEPRSNSNLVVDEVTPLNFKVSDKMNRYIENFLAERYLVQFDINDSAAIPGRVTGMGSSITVAVGESVFLPALECDYCTFEGWQIGNTFVRGQWTAPSIGNDSRILTAKAVWTRNFTPITDNTELSNIGDNPDVIYVLMRDINLDGIEWSPIKTFSGMLDGNGKTIYKLNKNLIKTNNGTIENLRIVDAQYSEIIHGRGDNSFGILVCVNNGTIERCSIENSTISISRTNYAGDSKWYTDFSLDVGGIAGSSYGIVSNCQVLNSTIEGKISNANIYDNQGCFDSGDMTSIMRLYVGGTVGYTDKGSVKDCLVYYSVVKSKMITQAYKNNGGIFGIGHTYNRVKGYYYLDPICNASGGAFANDNKVNTVINARDWEKRGETSAEFNSISVNEGSFENNTAEESILF